MENWTEIEFHSGKVECRKMRMKIYENNNERQNGK